MKEDVKNVVETVASHPKVALAITAAFTSNVWLDYGLPIVQGVTSIAGMFVVVLLAVQRFRELVRDFKGESKK